MDALQQQNDKFGPSEIVKAVGQHCELAIKYTKRLMESKDFSAWNQMIKCDCNSKCNTAKCPCWRVSSVHPKNKILLNGDDSTLICPCDKHCGCGKECLNKLIHRNVNQLFIKKTERTGYGVFTKIETPAGWVIGSDIKGQIKPLGTKGTQRVIGDYLITINSVAGFNGFVLDGYPNSSIHSLVNHSCQPNSRFVRVPISFGQNSRLGMLLVTNTKISQGQELTVNYGGLYIQSREMKCLCNTCFIANPPIHLHNDTSEEEDIENVASVQQNLDNKAGFTGKAMKRAQLATKSRRKAVKAEEKNLTTIEKDEDNESEDSFKSANDQI